jgi:aspartate-semialdehyde dehydrogenase
MVGHAVELRASFEREPELTAATAALKAFPGVVLDDLPTPVNYAGIDDVAVGRLRRDLSDSAALNLFVVGDNLRKGAALNAVQIAELLVERDLIGDHVAAASAD